LGFSLLPGEHPIVPVMLGDAVLAQRMAAALAARGVHVAGFFFPVVPKGQARIRTQMNAAADARGSGFCAGGLCRGGPRGGGDCDEGCWSRRRTDVGLWLEDRPVPEIGPEDVLIKVHKTGICGTDIHIWNWDDWARRTVPWGWSPAMNSPARSWPRGAGRGAARWGSAVRARGI
jgi:hypothetical protein